jgi:hypothetical protein
MYTHIYIYIYIYIYFNCIMRVKLKMIAFNIEEILNFTISFNLSYQSWINDSRMNYRIDL